MVTPYWTVEGNLRPPLRTRPVRWEVNNFKSIDHAVLDMSRLSILTGANSAGKSSLVQSLLFLAQCTIEGQISLNGPVVMLGEAEDVVRLGQEVVTLGITVATPKYLSPEDRTMVSLYVDLKNLKGELSVQGIALRREGRVVLEASHLPRSAKKPAEFQKPGGIPTFRGDEGSLLRIGFIDGIPQHDRMMIELNALLPDSLYTHRSERQRIRDARDLLKGARDRMNARELEFLLLRALSDTTLSPR